ncbi:MAG: hypothetical protein U7126_25940 [Microcoleus sp.]
MGFKLDSGLRSAQDLNLIAHLPQFSIKDFIVWWGRVYEIVSFQQFWLVKPAPRSAEIIQSLIHRTGYNMCDRSDLISYQFRLHRQVIVDG